MKKYLLVFFELIIISVFFCFAKTTSIRLFYPFRLNPILGINGDDNEASSKFVQRMIFSPLVFPLEDPYLQDDYSYALDLSLIDQLEYSRDKENWTAYNLKNTRSLTGSGYVYFRARLRENLNFPKNAGIKKRELTVEDVVYSYRISRITMDRAYQKYLKEKNKTLGLNTLMYSKLKSFRNVYCTLNDDRYVYFIVDSNKNGDEFLKLLVYVPILSSIQINTENIKSDKNSYEYISIHKELDMTELLASGKISNDDYNMYDINKLLLDEKGRVNRLGKKFFERPIGYGQFTIDGRIISYGGGGGNDYDLWERITLVKNQEWCNFPDSEEKTIGRKKIKHDVFRNKDDKLIIKQDDDVSLIGGIMALGNEGGALYNVPLTVTMLGDMELIQASNQYAKRKMQISHSLYGIYFGPAVYNASTPLYREVRNFFACFADRVRIENILKYIRGDTQFETFDNTIKANVALVSDLSFQKLYYPFYIGGKQDKSGNRSDIGKYYDKLEELDELYQRYNVILNEKTLFEYYNDIDDDDLMERQDFYNDYVAGIDFPKPIQGKIDAVFQNARTYILNNNGEVRIDIFYFDDIGETIALHYKRTLEDYFRKERIINSIDPIKIEKYNEWRDNAIRNAGEGKMSLLIKGWNYRFDLLDELRSQFIDKLAFDAIENRYKEMIEVEGLNAEAVFYRIAEEFVNNNVMIPLIGVQNYVVYKKGNITSFDENQDIEILLLPYYW
jgi:hypothetical protein